MSRSGRTLFAATFACSALVGCSNSGNEVVSPMEASAGDASGEKAGDATLASLVVTASPSDAAAVTLTPEFDPAVHDYYVRCAPGMNTLQATIVAARGATARVVTPTPSASAIKQTLAVDVPEGQLVGVAVAAGSVSSQYWVRCLPHDFPEMRWTPHPEAGPLTPGYYLLGNDLVAAGPGFAVVLDAHGVPVWYFQPSTGFGVVNVDTIMPNTISFFNNRATPVEYELHHLSPVSTTFAAPEATLVDQHELQRLANGHFMVISDPVEGGVDLSGLKITEEGKTVTFGSDAYILACNLAEFDANNHVHWRWTGTDHLDAMKETTFPNLWGQRGPGGAFVANPFHCNSVAEDPATGNLLISARNMDAVFYIEKSTGNILWKIGGTAYSKDGAILVAPAAADRFYRQHDARLYGWKGEGKGGSGQISVFDDETGRKGELARGVLYDVTVVDPAIGKGSSSVTVSWQAAGTQSSSALGSFRIDADGSRILSFGISAGSPVFTELDEERNDLLDFFFTDQSFSYRTIKVPLSTFDVDMLRSTATP